MTYHVASPHKTVALCTIGERRGSVGDGEVVAVDID